jgi:hypothetical protein
MHGIASMGKYRRGKDMFRIFVRSARASPKIKKAGIEISLIMEKLGHRSPAVETEIRDVVSE